MGAGLIGSTIVPFVYWFKNPQLTHMEVFNEVWWLPFGGIAVVFIAIRLAGNDEENRVPKMRNPPPPPEKKSAQCDHDWSSRAIIHNHEIGATVICSRCDTMRLINFLTRSEAEKLLSEYEHYTNKLLSRQKLVPSPKMKWFLDEKFEND